VRLSSLIPERTLKGHIDVLKTIIKEVNIKFSKGEQELSKKGVGAFNVDHSIEEGHLGIPLIHDNYYILCLPDKFI
jgi:hypothetical protein